MAHFGTLSFVEKETYREILDVADLVFDFKLVPDSNSGCCERNPGKYRNLLF
jgi:hypothetical protein